MIFRNETLDRLVSETRFNLNSEEDISFFDAFEDAVMNLLETYYDQLAFAEEANESEFFLKTRDVDVDTVQDYMFLTAQAYLREYADDVYIELIEAELPSEVFV